jgi:hypothetical protein
MATAVQKEKKGKKTILAINSQRHVVTINCEPQKGFDVAVQFVTVPVGRVPGGTGQQNMQILSYLFILIITVPNISLAIDIQWHIGKLFR